ncbi:ATP-binding protein [Haloferula sp. BvORR071]|uniref:hybrid sensor histidine kinase/response regulator n=1 Tax=Haloferula sp. BvORR071 TaxID=1396141 RepID=UPI002240F27E|nr:ATP-binding protein [Haloferula sp. BvORR071]
MAQDNPLSGNAADLNAGFSPALRELADEWETGAWIADREGNRIWFNKAWSGISGRDPSEELNDGWTSGLPPDDKVACLHKFRTAFERGVSFYIEHPLRDKEGIYRRISNHVVPLPSLNGPEGFFGTAVILEDDQNKQRPPSDSDFERELIESAVDFAIFTICEELKVVSWSAGAERIFGYHEDEIVGQSFEILFTPEDRAAEIPGRELVAAARDGRSSDERWHLKKDGTRFFASGTVSPVKGSRPVKFVKIARDLTSRKLMEDALSETDRRKNEFIATLAHELRNPLAPIRTGIELLNRPDTPEEVRKRVLGIMEGQMNTMVHLIDDLLEVSRITQGKIVLKAERVDLSEVVRSAVAACQNTADQRRREIPVHLPAEPIWVQGDVVRLEQCVVNLLLNAFKFTSPDEEIEIFLHARDESVELTVADTGAGLRSEELDSIFELFSQGSGSDNGLGIGLAVVKSLTELHGGSVSAESAGLGLGSKFTIRLPRADSYLPVLQPPDVPVEPPVFIAGTVLVVDDNLDAAELLKTALEARGISVITASDGLTAVSKAIEFRPRFCICDIGLPGIDGYEVARRVLEQSPQTTFIAVSGWGGGQDRSRSQEAGFTHHLVKPVKLDELLSLLADSEVLGSVPRIT